MCIRSKHFPGNVQSSYGEADESPACAQCGCQVYCPHEAFGEFYGVEHLWSHVEHLLLACPTPVPACAPTFPVDLLRADLLQAEGDHTTVAAAILMQMSSVNQQYAPRSC